MEQRTDWIDEMIVQPAFDISTKTWFVEFDNGFVEAPSLRELKKQLPPRTQIEGYHPNGYGVKVFEVARSPAPRIQQSISTRINAKAKIATRAKAFAAAEQPKPEAKAEPVVEPEPVAVCKPVVVRKKRYPPRKLGDPKHRPNERIRKYDHEAIIRLWAAGNDAPTIAKMLGIDNWLRVHSILYSARARGDRRAKKRGIGWSEKRNYKAKAAKKKEDKEAAELVKVMEEYKLDPIAEFAQHLERLNKKQSQ